MFKNKTPAGIVIPKSFRSKRNERPTPGLRVRPVPFFRIIYFYGDDNSFRVLSVLHIILILIVYLNILCKYYTHTIIKCVF